MKQITFQSVTPAGLCRIGPTVEALAAAEGLHGHGAAVAVRLSTCAETVPLAERCATVQRETKETAITITLNLDGQGEVSINTGIGFFDHMLEQLAYHSRCDLTVQCQGDLQIDTHHTIEDVALALGTAFCKALGAKRGIARYGFLLPMDEARAQVALDFSGRSYLVWEAEFEREQIGAMPTEMFQHFFRSFTATAHCTLHITAHGDNEHHKIEAVFKAVGKCIAQAVRRDEVDQAIPSTKGVL